MVALLLFSDAAQAVTSDKKLWTFRQPDGTPFQAVLIGSEFYAYHQTPGGEIIVQDPASGYWYYATPRADGTLEQTPQVVGRSAPQTALLNKDLGPWLKAVAGIAEQRAQAMTISFLANEKVPPMGTVKGVLLLANFSDTTPTFAQADFNGLMNTPGYNQHGALGSVRDYYYEASYGALTIQLDVYGWFNLPQTRYYYGHNMAGPGSDQAPQQMIADAITASNSTVNYANYDADGDGWVDFFGVVHQGQGEEQSGAPEDCIWSHRWNLGSPMTVDGKQVQDYYTTPEIYQANLSTIGVFCHEMGHLFNLPDLYDTVGSSEGVGDWSVMASGNWCGPGGNGAKPCHFDPWCKMMLGWVRPTPVWGPRTGIPLPNYDQNAAVLRIPIDPYQDGEYFLVCNRYQRSGGAGSGFDQYLPGSGALILHVDDYAPNNNTVARKKVDVEEADGLNQLDTGANRGNAGDLYPNGASAFNDTSNPNSKDNDGNSTGIAVNAFTGGGTAAMTCSVTPRASLSGKYIGYDDMGTSGTRFGWDGDDYGCVHFTTLSGGTLRRVKTYFSYVGTIDYTVHVYSGWSGGQPTGLLTTQSGSHTGRGSQAITLSSPQTFAPNTDFYVQVEYNTNYMYQFVLPFGQDGTCDGRSWVSDDGSAYTNVIPANGLPYDLNIRADLESATGTIKQDGTADFTNFTDAITWANAMPGANTLLVLDTATYVETPPAITEAVTIQGNGAALAGSLAFNTSGVAINNLTINGSTANHIDATSGAAATVTTCTLDGSSSDNARVAAGANLNMSDCTIRNASGSGVLNQGGTLTLTNCTIYGNGGSGARNTGSVCAATVGGGTIRNNSEHGVTCEYAGTSLTINGNATIRDNTKNGIYITAAAVVSVSSLTLQNNGYDGVHWTSAATSNTNNSFSNCTFQQQALCLFNIEDGCFVKKVELTDPSFSGKCGDELAFYIGTGGAGNASAGDGFRIVGTVSGAQKVDLDPIITGGTQRIARIRKGDLVFVKCKGTKISADNVYAIDSWGASSLGGDVKVVFDRCYWQNGAGSYWARTEGGGSGKVVLDAANTIWVWDGAAAHNHRAFLNLGGNHAGASEVWLRHCTLKSLNNPGGYNMSGSLVRGNENFDGSPNGRGDVLYGGWSIFDASGVTGAGDSTAGSNLGLTRYVGYPSAPCVAWRASGLTGFSTTPAETINLNPNLAPSGYLQNQVSYAAMNHATNSPDTSDIDDNARPLPVGSTKDIGAHESSYNDTTAPAAGVAAPPAYANTTPIAVPYSGAQDDASGSGLNKVELWYKFGLGGTWTNTGLTQTGGSGTFNFVPLNGEGTYYFDLAAEDNFGNRTPTPSGNGDGSTIYDITPPSATAVTPTTPSPTNSSTISFSVHFTEAVQNFNTAADLVITETGTVAHTGATFAGGPQDYTVTVTGVTGDGTMQLAVSTGSDVRDLASNALASSVTSSAVTIDRTAPTAATITPTTASPTNGTTVSFSVHFSEDVQNFRDAADLVITETGTVAHTGATFAGGRQDYAVTVTGVTGDGTMQLAVSTGSDVRDLVSNALASSVTSAAVTIDHTAPTAATITPTTASPTNGTTVSFSVHFSEGVQNFNTAADLVITETGTAAHTGATFAGGPQDYTVTVTGVTGDGTVRLAVSTGSDVRDLASNALASSVTSSAVTIDHTAPTAATITPTTASPTNGTTVSFSVHFSEGVQNFNTAADLVITETGTVAHTGATFAGGPQDYTVTVTGVTGDGTVQLAVSTGSDVRDLASNALASSVTSSAVTIDHTAPTAATITPTTASPTNGTTVSFSVHFSEGVQNFNTAADLVITETGTVAHTGATVAGGPQDYTVTVTGVTGDGPMQLAVSTGSDVRDLASNALASSVTSAAVTIDHTAPTAATITPTTPSPTNSSAISFSVHFSEDVQNFNNAADLLITETGTVAHTGATVAGGPQDYTVTVTGVTGDGTMQLAVSTGSDVRDLASNSLASSVTSAAVTIDHTAPTAVTITPTTPSPTGGSAISFSVHFSENVVNFNNAADLVITETGTVADAGATITGGPQDYAVTVTGVTGDGTMQLAVSTGSDVRDLASNALASSVTSAAVTIDHTAPTAVTITPTTPSPTGGSAISFSVHFSENVVNFNNAADLVITETGTVAHTGATVTGGPQDYAVTVTGVTGDGTMQLAVSTGSDVRDLVSYSLASSPTSAPVTVDHRDPSVSMISPVPDPTNASPIPVTVTFSQGVAGFELSDVTVSNAAKSNFQTIDAAHYTFELTPLDQGPVSANIAAGVAQDTAGNLNMAAIPLERVFDSIAPTAALTLLTPSPTTADGVVFDVVFNEPLSLPLAADDVTLTGTLASAAGASVTGAGAAYTVTVTPVDPGADGTIGIAVGTEVTDAAGNHYAGGASALCTIYNWFGFSADITGARLYVGDTDALHVAVNCGSGPLAYQWKWDDGLNKAIHDVGNEPTYTIANATLTQQGDYWCEVTYSGATHISNKAAVTIEPHLSITQEPQGGDRDIGGTQTFHVETAGGYQPLTYVWTKNGVVLHDYTSDSFTLDPLQESDSGAYTVEITDDNMDVRVSEPAILTVVSQGVPVAGLAGFVILMALCAAGGAIAIRRKKQADLRDSW
jgi:M6 family metalloprotease-like protein